MNEPAKIDLEQLQKTVRVNRQVINRLKNRVSILESALELVCGDPMMQWLYRNRSERMDANVPLFDPLRAKFHAARYEFAADYGEQFVRDKTVADIACGTGYGCRILVERGGAAEVTGVDICREATDYAVAKHGLAETRYVRADGQNTGLANNSIDCLTSFETIEHVDDDGALIAEFARLLKPGGMLICSTPNGWPLEIAPHHVRVYDRNSFEQLLETHFEVDAMFNQNSGSDFEYNHGQAAGIIETTAQNFGLAECFIAVARRR